MMMDELAIDKRRILRKNLGPIKNKELNTGRGTTVNFIDILEKKLFFTDIYKE